MIFTRIYIDNLYCFSGTEVDLTFNKKRQSSTIEHEHLSYAPNFKYKKVVVITGQNASGKTAFGKVLCGIQNFVSQNEITPYLKEGIHDSTKLAVIDIEFVSGKGIKNTPKLHRLRLSLQKENGRVYLESAKYSSTPIQKTESNTSARKRLNAIFDEEKAKRKIDKYIQINYQLMSKSNDNKSSHYQAVLEMILSEHSIGGWSYSFSEQKPNKQLIHFESIYVKYLPRFLSTFDPSIRGTEELFTTESNKKILEGIKVIFKNGDSIHITGDGMHISEPNRLSRGTLEGIEVAKLFSYIKSDSHDIYYIDEQMAYCHSELEISMLNVLIESLPQDKQLFYTTHNYDIIGMNLPPHSYYIFRKKGEFADVVDIGTKFTKNDRSLLNYVRNDAFDTLPDTYKIDSLSWEEL